MHRLQISLTKTQYEFLRSESFVSQKSMAAVLRDLLDEAIQARQQDILNNDPIWEVIGVGQEIAGPTDVSANVDKYLYGEPLEMADYAQLPKVAEESDEYAPDWHQRPARP
ncbi:MAG: hypothetical protein JW953_15080 [Anaerolineae bacterium]|nr:hypothetical protein [Anaerolineae bacterium]